jgi:Ca-activated chloride channel family protein
MRNITTIILLLTIFMGTNAQNERKAIRQGIKAYDQGEFNEAEVQFRKAGDLDATSFEADFNTGAALYEQEKYQETVKQYESLVQQSSDPEELSKVWHNMGNSLLEASQYQASIEAYKNSLRLNPGDMDSKYNLAYARKKLQEQQQQQQNQDQNQQNQDKQDQNQDQQQKQQNQDQQQQQDQQAQNQEQQNEQNQQPQDQNQPQEQEQQAENQEQQARPLEISKEDAERMLSAIQQQEKDVKQKVDKQKAVAAKGKTEKDW